MKCIYFIVLLNLYSSIAYTQVDTHSNEANTIEQRIAPPKGYYRTEESIGSFAHYLRTLPLQPAGSVVHYYNGAIKPAQVHAAVVRMDVGGRDLQQCADAVMRLRAEYLYSQRRYGDISFAFTNGLEVPYSRWRKGDRVGIEGNRTWWKIVVAQPDTTYAGFRRYMDLIFTYAGTLSLSKSMHNKPVADIAIGDVFIQGGSPGHAVMIADMAVSQGRKVVLLVQSYMPAQEIHVLLNLQYTPLSPWYTIAQGDKLYTPEWVFEWSDLKEF